MSKGVTESLRESVTPLTELGYCGSKGVSKGVTEFSGGFAKSTHHKFPGKQSYTPLEWT